MKKKTISIILALCMIFMMMSAIGLADSGYGKAYAVGGGNIYYTLENNDTEITIRGSDDTVTAVDIPEKIDGVPVTCIGPSAFRFCEALTSVSVPSGVLTIEHSAFYQCRVLALVKLPEGLETIGD
ncbi:MAG: leucine-rich repeat protein, partial [Clostridia bacterium]|nr:leucine-rich repeat protein [Clostridia bacterium]